ncbi:uncharacterized protein LOC129772857 [Toxorhynchites rutilus septentrionalis]|uniref:uncharacterized protein LOC129772857 n=1 Tax=Toxorhynchites rutilus septentrionalis TaxID=329112 RepID=UPI0024791053|nr:uncharacterized protein LOC129772857 [Toxorhynchites rutilus septentrionalis]
MSNEQRLEEEIARLQELLGTQAITTNNAAATNNVPDGPMAVNKIGIKVSIRKSSRAARDPPADDKYTKIKERIIQEYSTSEQNRMQQLLRGCELGDRKPSQLLREMRDLARDVITDEKIIKSLWMQQLPETTQAVLKVSETTLQLSQLAEQADKLADITRNRVASSVTASPDSTNEIGLAELRTRISEISNELAAFRQERSRSRNRSFNREQSFRSGSREYHPYCYYHRKFGANAKNCREPCQFKSKN